jgi:hypothetical protein
MACPDPLGPSGGCPLAAGCEACGAARQPAVAAYQTPVGVFCATVCGPCLAAGKAPSLDSWAQACERVAAHCQHLGIDLDHMAALLQAEHQEDSG